MTDTPETLRALRERAEDFHLFGRVPPIVQELLDALSAASQRADAAEPKAAAWDDIDRRGEEAHAYAQAHASPKDLGRNVWHVILDDAKRLRGMK